MIDKSSNTYRQAWWSLCHSTVQRRSRYPPYGIWGDLARPFCPNGNSMADMSCTFCVDFTARSEGTASNTRRLDLKNPCIAAVQG